MVTITQHRSDNTTSNIIDRDTVADAAAFLDGLAARYEGIPGLRAQRTEDGLTIEARLIGEPGWTTSSTYTIDPQETLND